MGYRRKVLRALLGASLAITVLSAVSTATANPLSGNKPCAGTNRTPPAGATKFLLTGDSIVHESRGDWTWRYFLYKQLVASLPIKPDFVGDYDWLIDPVKYDWPYCDYQDPNFDSDFTAIPGLKLSDYNLANSDSANLPYIQFEVQTWHPDVVVVLAGANDLGKGATAPDTVTAAQNVVTNARAANSHIQVVFVGAPTGGVWDKTPDAQYNALMTDAVGTWSTADSPVKFTDPMTGWGAADRTWDGAHPNVVGEQLIAKGIADALHSLGIGAPGLAVSSAVPFGLRNPVTNVVARLAGSTLKVSWTLPPGASGVQIMDRDTTSGAVGSWNLLKDVWWRPYDNTVGCPNPGYNANRFDPAFDPRPTVPCTSATISSGLVAGHSYDIALRSEKGTVGGGGGVGDDVAVDLFSNIQSIVMPPAAPVISSTVPSVHAVTVHWSADALATAYRVGWRVGTGAWKFSSFASGTSRAVPALTAGVKYDFRLQAESGTAASDYSADAYATPKAYPMAAPAKPVLKLLAGQKVKVTWTKVTGATRYLLQFRLGGGAWRSIGYFAATYTSPKLIKNKAYSFRLVPYDSTIAGKISPAAKITVK